MCFCGGRNGLGVLCVPGGAGEDVVEPLALWTVPSWGYWQQLCTVELFRSPSHMAASKGGLGQSLEENAQYSRKRLRISQIFKGLWASKGWKTLLMGTWAVEKGQLCLDTENLYKWNFMKMKNLIHKLIKPNKVDETMLSIGGIRGICCCCLDKNLELMSPGTFQRCFPRESKF